MIDVDSLKAGLDLAAIVAHYSPLQKRGREYVGRCVWHSPDEHPSMWVVPGKGLVHCFSCGASGDAIAFVQHVEGCDFQHACELLGATDDWQPTITGVPAIERPNRLTSAPPAGTAPPDMEIRELGEPTATWEYRDAGGNPLGYIARYEGAEGKEIRCWSWGARGDEPPAWGCGHWNKPRPLYGLDRLTARATTPVIVVEGEKAADAAGRMLPAYVVVTWPGGAQAWNRADWEPIRGRKVLLWPDNDSIGIEMMRKLAGIIVDPAGLCCEVSILDVDGMPPSWDAADAEAEGLAVVAWARPRKRAIVAPDARRDTETGAEPEPPDDTGENPPATPVSVAHAERPARRRPQLAVVGGREGAAALAVEDEPLPLALSEVGIADKFVELHQRDLRFVPEWKRWLAWDGARWRREVKRVSALAKLTELVKRLKYWPEAAALSPAGKSKLESRPYVYSVADLAEFDRRIIAEPQLFDADPWLLGTPLGTIDLRIGQLIESQREHYLTLQTKVAPSPGETPLFDRVIDCATGGSEELKAFLWRWLGYILSGDVREECFLFLHGKPQSGKTTLIEAVAGILGDVSEGGYATGVDMDLFCESRNDRGHDRLAGLAGARFAYASETEEGRHWKPSLLKWCTGGDTLRGRRLYEESFNFKPTHKLCVFGNHKPHLRSADDGVKRRIHLLEYHGAITDAERDNTLKARLVEEYPAILARMIDGCLDWQRSNGLNKPAEITANIETYFESEDSLGSWLDEKTARDVVGFLPSADAYRSFSEYMEQRGERAPTQKRFSMMIQAHDFKLAKRGGVRGIDGLRLLRIAELSGAVEPPIPEHW